VVAVCTSFCTLSLTGSSDAFIITVHASPCLFCPTNEVVLSLSWFVSPFQRLSTLLAPCSSIGFYCNIMAELFSKDLSSCPRRTDPWPSSEAEDPVEKSYPSGCTYNSHIKKDLVCALCAFSILVHFSRFQVVNPWCPLSQPHTFSARLLFAQPLFFAVVNSANVELSVFSSPVSTCCWIFLQL